MKPHNAKNSRLIARRSSQSFVQVVGLYGFSLFLLILRLPPAFAADCLNFYEEHYFRAASAAAVQECSRWGADPNMPSEEGRTALHRAAQFSGDARVIAALADAGGNPNARDESGRTPLHIAALLHRANPVIATTLVEVGANPNARDEDGWTPLHYAARYNTRPNLIVELTRLGADPNARDRHDKTPLHFAASHGVRDAIFALTESGADPKARDENGWTPLHSAAVYSRIPAVIVPTLLEAGADPRARDKIARTPLHVAAGFGSVPGSILALVNAGADPNAPNQYGSTPLHYAALFNSRPHVIIELADAGADPNSLDGDNLPPLFRAAADSDETEVITTLVRVGANLGTRNEHGQTVFHAAAANNDNPLVVHELASLGVDPNAGDTHGQTPLHYAAQFNKASDVIYALAETGANPNARDKNGWTPLHHAAAYTEFPENITALVDVGAEPDARNGDGWTPLHLAAEASGERLVVFALLQAGADPFSLRENRSPLVSAAIYNVNVGVAEMLFKTHLYGADGWWAPLEKGLQAAECWFDAHESWPRKECYFMVVNEDPDDAESPLIAFPVVRFFTHHHAKRNPILHLGGGGPGVAMQLGQGEARAFWTRHKGLVGASGRDFYVMDPRGVGMAFPRLHCPEPLGPKSLPATLANPVTAREEYLSWRLSYRVCKERLDRQGHDLSHYNSRTVARDVELLRRALNVEQWVLYGGSYASRYALTIARDFPDTAEAMILNGAVFPNMRHTDLWARQLNGAFERAFTWCDSSGLCAVSELRERFWELAASLDESPLVVDPLPKALVDNYDVKKFALTGERLVDVVFSALYDPDFFAELHVLVHELSRRKSRLLVKTLDDYFMMSLDVTSSDPVFYAHYCAEEYPFVSYD